MATLEVHILTCDYDWILPWSLLHWQEVADKIVVHDGGPKGWQPSAWKDTTASGEAVHNTKFLCESYGAVWKQWDTAGELNDALAMVLKNTCWRGTDADWVAVVDADELLYFPAGVDYTLCAYERMGAAMIKPRGFDMFSEVMPEPGQQITECCQMGATEEKWYSKPILFSPRRVADPGFGIGAHEARAVLYDGRVLLAEGKNGYPFADPEVRLLHYKAIGSVEQVAARYDATRRRLSKVNIYKEWGNVHDSGIVHAEKKRKLMFDAGLRNVVA